VSVNWPSLNCAGAFADRWHRPYYNYEWSSRGAFFKNLSAKTHGIAAENKVLARIHPVSPYAQDGPERVLVSQQDQRELC
jgi:hypothetical protein